MTFDQPLWYKTSGIIANKKLNIICPLRGRGGSHSSEFSWCHWGHDEWFWHGGAIRTNLWYE